MTNDAQPTTEALQLEIDRLTYSDNPQRAKLFSSLIRANYRSWVARHPDSLLSTQWELAEATLARLDVALESPELPARHLQLAESVQRLISLSDPQWISRCPRRLTLLRRLSPGAAQQIWDLRP